MNYIDKNLMVGESVLYRAKLHRIVFLKPIIWLIAALFLFGNGRPTAPFGMISIFIAIATAIDASIKYKTSEFGVTTRRVIVKIGLIRSESLELLLNKIEGIQVDQNIIGRIFDFGSITVSGTGGTRDPFRMIGKPFEFRKRVQEQIVAADESRTK
jgi:uncharacterized membrane protein YdbT with pleckstrin-like domain